MEVGTVSSRILLLLSIKEEGRYIPFDHVYEKVARDTLAAEKQKLSPESVKAELQSLLEAGLVEQNSVGYAITDQGEMELAKTLKEERTGFNRSYVLVWKARRYYAKAGPALLPFLRGRAVSVIKVFSGKQDPINEVNALFVRYKRYKPSPVPITIDEEKELEALVDDHAIDFIPYVSSMGKDYPDYLILDLDAGEELKKTERGFLIIKAVATQIANLLDECDVNYLLKFSGSRGFQIWARLDNSSPSLSNRGDLFAFYRQVAIALRDRVETDLQADKSWVEQYGLENVHWPVTSSVVAKKDERANQVLIDWSSMKPNGDARAPYSIHYRTGLVSLPISARDIKAFERGMADPENLLEEGISAVAPPEPSDPEKLLKRIGLARSPYKLGNPEGKACPSEAGR